MKKSCITGVLSAVIFSFNTLPSHAALIGVLPATPGGSDWQAIYDTDRDISWVANANLAASNTFGLAYDTDLGNYPGDTYGPFYSEQILTDGRMNWGAALHWIDAMNAANYLGFNNWRLPATLNQDGSGPCSGYNCTGSDMGHLYYTEGVRSGTSDLFSDVQPSYYWSSEEDNPFAESSWGFTFYDGKQLSNYKGGVIYTWTVHSGDVGVIPIPPALWLFGSGLLGLIGIARRKTA